MAVDPNNRLTVIDPGIASAVAVLRHAHVEVFEACEGGPCHSFREPTVRFYGERAEGYRALAVALAAGLPVMELHRVWQVNDGEIDGPYWELTFHETVPQESSAAPVSVNGTAPQEPH